MFVKRNLIPTDWGLFTNTSRGFSFEVQNACFDNDTPVNCSLVFDNTTSEIIAYGSFGREQIPSDPDIAGAGVSCQFFYSHLYKGVFA